MTKTYEYQISERSILKRGTPFRATQGPYYVTEDGEQISMAGRGPLFLCGLRLSKTVTISMP